MRLGHGMPSKQQLHPLQQYPSPVRTCIVVPAEEQQAAGCNQQCMLGWECLHRQYVTHTCKTTGPSQQAADREQHSEAPTDACHLVPPAGWVGPVCGRLLQLLPLLPQGQAIGVRCCGCFSQLASRLVGHAGHHGHRLQPHRLWSGAVNGALQGTA